MKYYLFFSLLVLSSCFKTNQAPFNTVSKQADTSPITNAGLADKIPPPADDSIIWSDDKVKIYAQHTVIDEGEEQIKIFNNQQDTLLIFNHEDGGNLTFPFVIETGNEVFINFFEVWDGSGFLSKKRFYHLNDKRNKLHDVKATNLTETLKTVKDNFSIKDSLYCRKGEFYKDFMFEKSCFTQEGELPFSMVLYNHTNKALNKGLEGFKRLKGKYVITQKNNDYQLIPQELELINP